MNNIKTKVWLQGLDDGRSDLCMDVVVVTGTGGQCPGQIWRPRLITSLSPSPHNPLQILTPIQHSTGRSFVENLKIVRVS